MAQDTLQAYTRTICGQSALDSALRRCDCLFHATKVMTLFEIWNKKNNKKREAPSWHFSLYVFFAVAAGDVCAAVSA